VEPYPTNRRLREYDGHGTFISGVLRCRAPKAEIVHYRIGRAGAISETDMVAQLQRVLNHPAGAPHIINLSAGCHTRRDHGLKSFETLWRRRLSTMPGTVLIAAAGNDASDRPFYPAARGWAIGVGSLDHHGGQVSSFSNYGLSADIYVLGRGHVNAFPEGSYVCKEAPNKGDKREFGNGLARWSGTSFATPLFAGLVAARLSRHPGSTATQVARHIVDHAPTLTDPLYGTYSYLHINDGAWTSYRA
jgi:subtilisin family serine protease